MNRCFDNNRLIGVITMYSLGSLGTYFSRASNRPIKLDGFPGWSEFCLAQMSVFIFIVFFLQIFQLLTDFQKYCSTF